MGLLRCVQSPTVSSIPRTGLIEKPFLCGHTAVKFINNKRICPDARKLKFIDFRAQASVKSSLEAPNATPIDASLKDSNLVFVAGATGRVGSRVVRELLKLGFKVRAGVRNIQRAESLVQSVKSMKLEDVAGEIQPIDKLELVECDLEKQNQISPALGNASIVLCCIGASEKEVFDITGPYRIDYQATKNLIDAAASAKVDHFILLTSLGTNKFGFPAAILNLFWGVLCWKRKAEEALLASGLPYTIVRPGGMERPTDSYKETHNIALSQEDTLFGGQVSNLQVAELMAFMAKNRSLSYCKVVEVIAETTAPLTSMGELLKNIPSQREEIYPIKESDDADGPQPEVPDNITSGIPSTSAEEKPKELKATSTTPLSPYIAYEDLKPPTSPTPTPSIGASASKSSNAEATPAASNVTSSSIEVKSSETSSTTLENGPLLVDVKKTNHSSPYTKYEDLKPPSSPSPNVPTISVNNVSEDLAEDNSGNVNEHTESKPRPLSPYVMYEDLKPPSSPIPSKP
ncbi:protein TIC 62, chloroplastic isoform X2 [Olea europaea var. sylvestris]|uniref:protein TIC 62, chloroplastic isoform X2 n=1 Tax=Olea europaea var. sylvestris TaxID=158386 RepID=UPI000C1D6E1F|nr:protein TIC 62, chloroplastic isoform X2 [Olea europaea var. sylvestris]